MKSSQQILGLPVLSIEEGKQIGRVRHLVLNPRMGTVDFLLVEDEAWYLGLKSLAFKAIQGIGEFALTVVDRSSLANIAESTGALELMETGLRLPGIKVLSKKGRLVGSVSEYFINENTGEITGCQLIPVNSEKPAGIIPKKMILTYGRDFLVVEEDLEDCLLAELPEVEGDASTDGRETGSAAETLPTPPSENAPQIPASEKQPADALRFFEEEQRRYILGKKVTARIVADNGEVVAEEGETVTDEVIERARVAGRYIQLTLNIRE